MKKFYKNYNLVLFLIGFFVSGVGTRLATVALTDKVIKLSNNDFSITSVYLLQSIPILLFGFIAGNLIEGKNKKYAMIAVNIIFAGTSVAFALTQKLGLLYLIILVYGTLMAFYNPLRVSLLPLLVKDDELLQANGLRVSVNGLVMIIGFAVGGLLVHGVGNNKAFIIDGLSYLVLAFLFIFLRPKKQTITKEPKQNIKDHMASLLEGWRFIKTNARIKEMFFFCILTCFVLQMQLPLTYIFVEKHLGGVSLMAQRTGFLFSAVGIGVLTGGIILGYLKSFDKLKLLALTIIFDGFMVTIFALNRNFTIAVLIFCTLGIISSFTMSIPETVIQENTSGNMIGRVSGFMSSIIEPVGVLSMLCGGVAARFIGVEWVFIFSGVAELLVGSYFIYKYVIRAKVSHLVHYESKLKENDIETS